jgi:hypothetical protein
VPAARSALLVPALVATIAAWLFAGTTGVAAAVGPNSLGLRAEYDVQADIHFAAGSMTVSSTAHVKNTTSNSVGKLTFNLLPLRLGNLDSLQVMAGGSAVEPTVSDQSLIVPLPASLAPDETIDVTVGYRAFFNTDTQGKKALFMKKSGTIASYRWIPWLSRPQKFNTPNFGESWVTGTSPRVTVTFTSDVALKYATSGVKTGGTGLTQTFAASDVRDFNFAASPNYHTKKVTWNGIKVTVFYKAYDPDALLSKTLLALERFTDKIGAYPYDHLSVAETPAGVGMESPGMTWIDATLAKSRFAYIVVHETSHQWFYSTIGNNQATDPFLDEAVADFLTRDALGSFRSSDCALDRLDRTVYDYQGRCYNEVIYVQGGLYLRNYKNEVGANAFWAGMHNFYVARKFDIANTRSLFDYLDAASGYPSQQHADRFPSLYP